MPLHLALFTSALKLSPPSPPEADPP